MSTTDGQNKASGISKFLSSTATKLSSHVARADELPHQFRQAVATYSSPADTLRIHLAIKASSGVVKDVQSLGREQQAYSKELYMWTKDEQSADVKDVGDRLAFVEFKKGELFKHYADKLEQSRVVLKQARNFENTLVPKRKRKNELTVKLQGMKGAKTAQQIETVSKMEAELRQLEAEERVNEDKLRLLRRQSLHESFAIEFDAQRELGEKLAILGTYGELLVRGMDLHGVDADYDGHAYTARIRAEIDSALSSWSVTNAKIPVPWLDGQQLDNSSFLGRNDTLSFGSTHASELSEIPDSSSMHAVANAGVGRSSVDSTKPTSNTGSNVAAPALPPRTTAPGGFPLNLATTSPPPRTSIEATTAASPPLRDPFLETKQSSHLTSSHVPGSTSEATPVPIPNAPPGPTVSETGAVRSGTGGPTSGVLSTSPGKPSPNPIRLADLGSPPRQSFMPPPVAGSSAGASDVPPPSYDEDEARRAEQQADLILAREREAKRAPPA